MSSPWIFMARFFSSAIVSDFWAFTTWLWWRRGTSATAGFPSVATGVTAAPAASMRLSSTSSVWMTWTMLVVPTRAGFRTRYADCTSAHGPAPLLSVAITRPTWRAWWRNTIAAAVAAWLYFTDGLLYTFRPLPSRFSLTWLASTTFTTVHFHI